MKKIAEKFKVLSLSVKIQLVIAILVTSAIPVYAWFARQNRIEAMSKVKEPPSINLASGGDDPALYISLENIDVSKATEKYIVFSVVPGKYSAYDIQLTHTTNIPFTYELYRIQENENGDIEYTDHTRTVNPETGVNAESLLHYSIMSGVTDSVTTSGRILLEDNNPLDLYNDGTRILGDENTLAINRKNYDTVNDDVNQYVKPVYSIARRIRQLNENEDGSKNRDYFAIKLSWATTDSVKEGESHYWDYAFNNKETDIIYISAKQNAISENTPTP